MRFGHRLGHRLGSRNGDHVFEAGRRSLLEQVAHDFSSHLDFLQPFYLFQPLRSKLLILTHRLLGGG